MGRHRTRKGRADWPTGLTERVRKGVRYYSYRDPVTKREIGLGADRTAAIQAIRIVQRKRAPDPVQAALAKIEKPRGTVGDHLDWFLKTHLPQRRTKSGSGLSQSTLDGYRIFMARVRSEWGARDIASVDRAAIVKLIESYPAESGNKLRGMLSQLFAQARARGLRDDNPVEGTVKRDVVIQRVRLDRAKYDAIHKIAPPWLQRAMTLSLLSLQRPGDLSAARRDSWDDKAWHVRQSKSRGHGYGLLRILPHDELRAAVQAAHENPVEDCPYLLAREPEKKRKAKGRGHWAQLSDEILSRAFAELRDKLATEKKWKWPGTPPSYYEIKALGARLYEEAGRPVSWIQALAGHQDEATTRIYTDRHREKWIEVAL